MTERSDIYLNDLARYTIYADEDGRASVEVSLNGMQILSEIYHATFIGSIDLREVVRPYLYPTISNDTLLWRQLEIFCNLDITVNGTTSCYTAYGFDRGSQISAIDFLRIPHHYILPIPRRHDSECCRWELSGLVSGDLAREEFPYTQCVELPITDKRLRLRVDYSGTYEEGPLLQPSSGDFEQYLFANDFGGFDNIPMDGIREFIPEYEFQTGSRDSQTIQMQSRNKSTWRQNSGFMTKAAISALSRLICSKHIWHLVDGVWYAIVITSCQLSYSSADSLHSMSFEYEYVNDNIR